MKWWTSPIIVCLVVALFAAPGVAVGDVSNISADDKKSAPDIFVALGCNECHTVNAVGIKLLPDGEKEGDLSKVGKTHDKKWIARYLLKKVEKDGEKHKKKFRGSRDELKAVATWLSTLK